MAVCDARTEEGYYLRTGHYAAATTTPHVAAAVETWMQCAVQLMGRAEPRPPRTHKSAFGGSIGRGAGWAVRRRCRRLI